MPKRSSKRETSKDINVLVARIVEDATTQVTIEELPVNEKNLNAVALGRLGGLKGGLARAKKLTAKQRSEIARRAAQARWGQSENKT